MSTDLLSHHHPCMYYVDSAKAFLTAAIAFEWTSLPAATIPSFADSVRPCEKSNGFPNMSVQIPPDSAMSREPEA